ncbi:MAG TPA: hypothetical protein VH590_02745, partial [Ktedonobacterales bacterium]
PAAVPPRKRLLDYWYHYTTPAITADGQASLAQRERARRARLASNLLLTVVIVWLVSGVAEVAADHTNAGVVPVFLVGLGFLVLLLFLNRRGLVSIVGGCLIALIYLSFVLILQAMPHLDPTEVAVFDLLIYAELIAVSLLPSVSIFPVAISNCFLILLGIFGLQGSSPAGILQTRALDTYLVEPITLQIFVAGVTYLWVRSTEQAIARADQAQLLAALRQREAEQKRELEAGLQELIRAFTLAANGTMTARVTLSQDHTLWQIGSLLNSLLNRLQRAEQAEDMLQRTNNEAARLVESIRAAKAGRPPLWPTPGGTPLDQVLLEIAGRRPDPY